MAEVYKPAASVEDGYWYPGVVYNSSGDYLTFGFSSSSYLAHVWIDFQSLAYAKGTTFASAIISLYTHADSTNTTPVRIRGNLAAPPTAPANRAACEALVYTTAYVDWTPGNWGLNEWKNTPDISSILNELCAQAGWSNPMDAQIVIFALGTVAGNTRGVKSWDYSDHSKCAYLTVTANPPAAGEKIILADTAKSGNPTKIMVGSSWKAIAARKLRVGGAWK